MRCRVLGTNVYEEVLCTESAFCVVTPDFGPINYPEWDANRLTLLVNPRGTNL